MIRKILTASIASAAIALAAPAVAGPGHGGGHGGVGVGAGANANAGANMRAGQGALNANANARLNTDTTMGTNPAAGVSQGPANASINGITHANSHSVLASGSVAGTTLPGLKTGLTVTNANNTDIGTISQIVTDNSGNIRLVIVTDTSTGQTFRLAPNTLSISGTTVTTTSTVGG